MASLALDQAQPVDEPQPGPRFDYKTHPLAKLLFAAILVGGLAFAGWSVLTDTRGVGEELATGVFLFLALALLIALGFEFVNGFHDTANAVATVIYTNSMPAHFAVIWSGFWNFLGVMLSSGAVAYSIITLLPVDLAANMRSLGVDVLRADTVDELREALRTARAADRPTAVHVETDPAKKQLPPEAWWDVPVAEVAALESTRAAREQYDHNRRDQRHYL